MYKIIYIKADYEPWWQFDGWEQHIVSTEAFNCKQQFNAAFIKLLTKFREKYENEVCKHERYFAFWSEEECEFCEACDEDAQIYHGIIIQTPEVISK